VKDCDFLENIYRLKDLYRLEVYNCKVLADIGPIPNLKYLRMIGCPYMTNMKNLNIKKHIYIKECRWLNYNNTEYQYNIDKVIDLQHRYKKKLARIAFIRRLLLIKYVPLVLVDEITKFL
jgi:hypothetical protein